MSQIKGGIYGIYSANAFIKSLNNNGEINDIMTIFLNFILPTAFKIYSQYGKNLIEVDNIIEEICIKVGVSNKTTLEKSACCIYVFILCKLLGGELVFSAVKHGLKDVFNLFENSDIFKNIISLWTRLDDIKQFRKISMTEVVFGDKTIISDFEAAIWCFINGKNYIDCIKKATYFDNNCVILTGGLAGTAFGYDSIPTKLIKLIDNKNTIDHYCDKLEDYCNKNGDYKFISVYGTDGFSKVVISLNFNEENLKNIKLQKNKDKYLGCMLGLAIGDDLENKNYNTQLALFTINGLLFGITRGYTKGIMAPYSSYVSNAYNDWIFTKKNKYPNENKKTNLWLLNIPEMYVNKNYDFSNSFIAHTIPLGLFWQDTRFSFDEIVNIIYEITSLINNTDIAKISSVALNNIIYLLSNSKNFPILDAVLDTQNKIFQNFTDNALIRSLSNQINRAIALATQNINDKIAIKEIQNHTTTYGNNSLPIAIYCALKYSDDFEKGITVSINNNDICTAMLTGAILGANLGFNAIPQKFLSNLLLKDTIIELTNDIYNGCPITEFSGIKTINQKLWYEKYVTATYSKKYN